MKGKIVSSMLGGISTRKAITLLNKNMYIRLLSVYENIMCDTAAKKLALSLTNDGADKKTANFAASNACLAALCLCDKKNKPIFNNGLDAMAALTQEELIEISNMYIELKDEFLSLHNLTKVNLNDLKKIN